MEALKGIQITIHPKGEQKQFLKRILGAQRWLWNHFLQCNIIFQMFTGKFIFYNEMANQLPALKKKYPWLSEAPSQTLQQTLKDLDSAIKASFTSGFGFPKFKSRNCGSDSARFPQGFSILDNKLKLPKLGVMNFIPRNGIENKRIRNITLFHDHLTDRFLISFCYEEEIEPLPRTGKVTGLDMGSVRLFTDSNGNWHDALRNHPVVKRLSERIVSEQQKLSDIHEKIKAGANNLFRQFKRKRKTVAVLHGKLANFVKDILHKVSRKLVEEYDLISVEDLKIRNMTKSAKGTLDDPGTNVKQKSGLNRNLLSNRISMFFNMLKYKCTWYGKRFVMVNPVNTSRMCSSYGYISKDNRPDQEHFKCPKCSFELNADHNAAINILRNGLEAIPAGV